MSFSFVEGNIFECVADAIVMPANPEPKIGKGLDALIYRTAGRNFLLRARRQIGEIKFGDAAITDAYRLRDDGFKYIIHAVSPPYDKEGGSNELLQRCYQKSLQLAVDKGCKSIVFPLLSTGVLQYPADKAIQIAEGACHLFLTEHDIDITLVKYNRKKHVCSAELKELDRYVMMNCYSEIDLDEYNQLKQQWGNVDRRSKEYREYRNSEPFSRYSLWDTQYSRKEKDEEKYKKFQQNCSLDEYMKKRALSFNDVLEKYRKKHDAGNNSNICTRGYLRESTLSKMCSKKNNSVSDNHLWALAFGLKLNKLDQVEELFNSCGKSIYGTYKRSEEPRARVLEYAVINGWDIDYTNIALADKGMPPVGNLPREDTNDLERDN